jgi:hypothetical protein
MNVCEYFAGARAYVAPPDVAVDEGADKHLGAPATVNALRKEPKRQVDARRKVAAATGGSRRGGQWKENRR